MLSSVILCNNNEPFLNPIVMFTGKWILYDNRQQPVGLRRHSKALPKAKLAPRKKSHGHFGGLLLVWSTTTCWIPAKPLHLRSMLSKSMSCTKNCSDLAAGIGQQNGPSSPRQCPTAPCKTSASEAEWVGLWSFASSAISTWPLANWLPLLQASQQLFAEKMLPQPAGCRKGFPRVRQILKHRFSCYRNKLISHWQKCVDCNCSYFDW